MGGKSKRRGDGWHQHHISTTRAAEFKRLARARGVGAEYLGIEQPKRYLKCQGLPEQRAMIDDIR
jgi:hypothetical protein